MESPAGSDDGTNPEWDHQAHRLISFINIPTSDIQSKYQAIDDNLRLLQQHLDQADWQLGPNQSGGGEADATTGTGDVQLPSVEEARITREKVETLRNERRSVVQTQRSIEELENFPQSLQVPEKEISKLRSQGQSWGLRLKRLVEDTAKLCTELHVK